jgi:hypothetical protein
MLLDIILAQWWHPVACIKALDLLHWAMCTVTYRHIAIMAIKTTSKVGVFVHRCLFACCIGGGRANTEQVVAQLQHPVASKVALEMPHRAMPSVLPQHTSVAKMANNGGAFVHHHCLFCMIIHSCKTMLWSIKTSAIVQY